MTWLAFKALCKKIWVWISHHWYVPAVVVYTIILWVLFRRPDAVSEMLQVRNDSYRKQIDTINKSHEDEIAKRNIILEKYNELITNITEEYKKDSKNLKEEQKKEIKKLVEQYHDNPDELAKLLAEEYGFAYVE